MDIQHHRVLELCNELRLGGVAAQYTALAQKAAERRISFTDFVEELLSAESRRARAREMFARIACFPPIACCWYSCIDCTRRSWTPSSSSSRRP